MSNSNLQNMHDYLWETPDPKYEINDSHFLQHNGLLIWRFFAFSVVFGNFCWMYTDYLLKDTLETAPFFSYLTIWGVILVWSFFLLAIVNMLNKNHIALLWKITHVIFELAASFEFLICLFFWSVLFPLYYNSLIHNPLGFIQDIGAHLVSPVFIWIDNYINNMSFYRRHIIFIFSFGAIYLTVNCIVTLNVQNIYPPITWVSITSYVLLLVGLGLGVLGFYLGMLLTRAKERRRSFKGGFKVI